jgi:hypothetical protein
MTVEGTITFEYSDSKTALDIARLIQVDNEIAPRNLDIHTSAEGKSVVTRIQSSSGKTVFATIDDVVFSEKLISEILNI